MQIHMTLTQTEPPAGTVRLHSDPDRGGDVQGGEEIGFSGWLGMLRAVSDLIGHPGDPADTG